MVISAEIVIKLTLQTLHKLFSNFSALAPHAPCVTVKTHHCMATNFLLYLFGVLRHFQHCTGHITMGSWKGRGNQYIEFVRVLYYKLPTNGKQLPAFPLEAVPGHKLLASVYNLTSWF